MVVAAVSSAIAAESYLIADNQTGHVLASQKLDEKLPVASLTKIATAAVALDWAGVNKVNLSNLAEISPRALAVGGVNPVGLQPGDQLSLRLYDGERLLIENADEPDNVQMMDFKVVDVPVGNSVAPFRLRGDDEQELLLPELLEQKTPLADADAADISEALHKRLVIALSCLFLPMLAVVLGVQSSRKRNLYQSVFALLIVVVYHQLVEFSGDFGRSIAVGPAVMLWTVYGAFFGTSAVLFYKTSTGIGSLSDRLSMRLGNLGLAFDPTSWLRSKPQTP